MSMKLFEIVVRIDLIFRSIVQPFDRILSVLVCLKFFCGISTYFSSYLNFQLKFFEISYKNFPISYCIVPFDFDPPIFKFFVMIMKLLLRFTLYQSFLFLNEWITKNIINNPFYLFGRDWKLFKFFSLTIFKKILFTKKVAGISFGISLKYSIK